MTHLNPIASHPATTTRALTLFLAPLLLGLALGVHPVAADDGNTLGSATPIAPGIYEAGLTSGDVDWFYFSLASTGLVAIYT
jgi:hypothetical protein